MNHRLKTYLRPYRRRWGLTEPELAFLLGLKSESVISRVERGGRPPTLKIALACQVVFGTPPEELFPGLFEATEQIVRNRAGKLRQKLQGDARSSTATKLELLDDVIARAIRRGRQI